jgi:O-antigen/teichoic acid export membrane protein
MLNNLKGKTKKIWDGKDNFSAVIQTFLSKFMIMFLNILTGIITARSLGPDGRGEQAAIAMWPQLLAYLAMLGTRSSLVYYWKKNPERSDSYLTAALLLSTGLSFFACIIGYIGLPYWLSNYSQEIIFASRCFLVTVPFSLISSILLSVLEIKGNFRYANILSQASVWLILLLLLIFTTFFQFNPILGALAYAIPAIPTFFCIAWLAIREFSPNFDNVAFYGKKLLGYGIRSYGVDLLGIFSSQLDQIFIVSQLSPRAMGIYAVSLSITRVLNITQHSLITVLFPKIAAQPLDYVVKHVGQSARLSALATIALGGFIAIFCVPIVSLLYGKDFSETIPIVRILLLEVLFGSTTWVLAQSFMALGKPETVTVLQAIGIASNIPLMMFLIPRYQMTGAAIALLISAVIRLIFIVLSYPLFLKVKPPSLFFDVNDWTYLKSKIGVR